MKRKITLTLAAVTALALSGGAAFAEGGHYKHHGSGMHKGGMHHGGMHRGGMRLFNKLDADKNGVVTRAEAEQARADRFAKLDANGDGTITVAEIDKAIEKKLRRMQVRMRYKMLSRLDTNGDGQVTNEEFTARPMRLFNRVDRNGDGEVTREEAKKMMRHMRRHGKRMRHMWKRWHHNSN